MRSRGRSEWVSGGDGDGEGGMEGDVESSFPVSSLRSPRLCGEIFSVSNIITKER
jgi:hypothetical protein